MEQKLNEKYLSKLKALTDVSVTGYGCRLTEDLHIEADYLLCELLTELGYTEIVQAYRNIPKWYS